MDITRVGSRAVRGMALAAVCLSLGPCAAAAGNTDETARPDTQAGPQLLIIAPERFGDALQEYVRHKSGQMVTELVPLETALKKGRGMDDPERLKRYLYGRWKGGQLRYVLLVGDGEVMPIRYMVLDRTTPAAFNYAFYPCDLYYADLARADGSFDDWNARKDSFHRRYIGEVRGETNKSDPINYDNVSYLPEIAVGRWPASTPADVRTIARKTMRYENGLAERAAGGAPKAALFVVDGWVDVRDQMDGMASKMGGSWDVERFFYSDDRLKPGTPAPDNGNLLGLLNSGAGMVVHIGHGGDTEWEKLFRAGDLKKVWNATRLPIAVSIGCHTGRFATLPPYERYVDTSGREHTGTDKGEVFTSPPPPPSPYQPAEYHTRGLGDIMLRGGSNCAVAYLGCNTGAQPAAMTLLEGFLTTAADPGRTAIGDCLTDAIRHFWTEEKLAELVPTESWYPASIFFQAMKFMLFGDPSLQLPPRRSSG